MKLKEKNVKNREEWSNPWKAVLMMKTRIDFAFETLLIMSENCFWFWIEVLSRQQWLARKTIAFESSALDCKFELLQWSEFHGDFSAGDPTDCARYLPLPRNSLLLARSAGSGQSYLLAMRCNYNSHMAWKQRMKDHRKCRSSQRHTARSTANGLCT